MKEQLYIHTRKTKYHQALLSDGQSDRQTYKILHDMLKEDFSIYNDS